MGGFVMLPGGGVVFIQPAEMVDVDKGREDAE
jgi:hypothetical protein